ncbi:hypothetical protein [uncultured Nostoc sp.]|uniref:hypothetical protein n=1 Tax=uncultured Nostoc sp. TaxID=340711 RepID=UPI0035CB37B3
MIWHFHRQEAENIFTILTSLTLNNVTSDMSVRGKCLCDRFQNLNFQPLNSEVAPFCSNVAPLNSEVAPFCLNVAPLNSEVAPFCLNVAPLNSKNEAQNSKCRAFNFNIQILNFNVARFKCKY